MFFILNPKILIDLITLQATKIGNTSSIVAQYWTSMKVAQVPRDIKLNLLDCPIVAEEMSDERFLNVFFCCLCSVLEG